MVATLLQVLFYLMTPLLTQALARRSKALDALGPVLMCYAIGIGIANVPGVPIAAGLAKDVAGGAVLLAIPALLFSTDFKGWVRTGGSAVLSFVFACAAAMLAATGALAWFGAELEEGWKAAAMLVGVYTGGTANLAAIGLALGARDETYILLNASDVVWSGLYLLFLLSVAKRVLGLVLPAYTGAHTEDVVEEADRAARIKGTLQAGLLAVGAAAGSAGASVLLTGGVSDVFVICAVTLAGILLSFHPRVRALPGSYTLGETLILVFCVAVGSLTNLETLFGSSSTLFWFTGMTVVLAVLIHFSLAALFRIDVDTAIITSTAAVFGPPFVALVAGALGNRRVILSGMTTGLVGYAMGTYLGLALAWLVH